MQIPLILQYVYITLASDAIHVWIFDCSRYLSVICTVTSQWPSFKFETDTFSHLLCLYSLKLEDKNWLIAFVCLCYISFKSRVHHFPPQRDCIMIPAHALGWVVQRSLYPCNALCDCHPCKVACKDGNWTDSLLRLFVFGGPVPFLKSCRYDSPSWYDSLGRSQCSVRVKNNPVINIADHQGAQHWH